MHIERNVWRVCHQAFLQLRHPKFSETYGREHEIMLNCDSLFMTVGRAMLQACRDLQRTLNFLQPTRIEIPPKPIPNRDIEVAVLNPKVANRFAQTIRRSKTDAADASDALHSLGPAESQFNAIALYCSLH